MERSLSFAKIVATPTPTSWSQAYNAGSLFAVLSLSLKEDKEGEENQSLHSFGKEILNTLEEEYFTLETKNLHSIKQAVEVTCKKIPDEVDGNLIVIAIVQTVLYGFVRHQGGIAIKRGDKIATILASSEQNETRTVSGHLKNDDLILLQTDAFSQEVPQSQFVTEFATLTPSEIAETLAPIIHGKDNGTASAILVLYNEVESEKSQDDGMQEVIEEEETKAQETEKPVLSRGKTSLSLSFVLPTLKHFQLPHRKKVSLTIAVSLGIVLVASIFLAVKKQNDTKTKVLFERVYTGAKTKYDEGQGLMNLNKNVGRSDLEEAQKIIKDSLSQFKKGTSEEKKLSELLQKIEGLLPSVSGVNIITPTEVDKKTSSLLSAKISYNDASYLVRSEDTVYLLDANGVYTVDGSDKKKEVIKNENDWSIAGGFGEYFGNLYILDKKANTILKYIPTGQDFGKRDYLTEGSKQDFSKAAAISLDTSVWVLFENGTIMKLFRGKPESFSISGLDTPFAKPTKIYTNSESDNLYILDNGNKRIVVLKKSGSYHNQYSADMLGKTVEFDIDEKDKEIYILVDKKVYKIEIK